MGVYIQVDFTDTEGTAYKIEISDATYSGVINQVQGKAILDYPKVKTMQVVRGSSLKIQLEASSTDTWQGRLVDTVGDKKLPVTLYRGGSVFWNGFIKPDGIVESFVTDYWVINIQAIDGLGLMENTKFLNSDDEEYKDLENEIDIIARCLELTGQTMDFRLYDTNMYYNVIDGNPTALSTHRALHSTYLKGGSLKNDDKENSVFTVKKVLESVLKKYGCYIIQQGNLWHIVKLMELVATADAIDYEDFNTSGVSQGTETADLETSLGSQIDSYDPHHAGANQQKNYKASLGAYKAVYKYRFIGSALTNPEMYFDTSTTISDWDMDDIADFTVVTEQGNYVGRMKCRLSSDSSKQTIYSTSYPSIDSDEFLTVQVKGRVHLVEGSRVRQNMRVKLITPTTDMYLNDTGEWTLSTADIRMLQVDMPDAWNPEDIDVTFNVTIEANGIPEDNCTIEVIFWKPASWEVSLGGNNYTVVDFVGVTAGGDRNLKGESHTYTRATNPTAVVETEEEMLTGDNANDLYLSAIKNSADQNTLRWAKRVGGTMDYTEVGLLLKFLAWERMTISSGNSLIFKGGVYGYLEVFGALTINNITGIFITTRWSYDLAQNLIQAEHERVFTDGEVDFETDYTFAYEDANVIKPAIE